LGAMTSIWLESSRPVLAGVLGGAVSALKYYPAAMIIGPRPSHRVVYAIALGAALVLVTAVSFAPLGLNGAIFYYQHVLLASLGSHNADCGYDSVRSLFDRVVGGEPYLLPAANGGVVIVSVPWHYPSLADAGADGSFSAGLLSPALRSSISKSVDVGGGSRFRFGRVAESIFPVGVIRRSGGWRLTLRSASLGSGTGPGKPGAPKARRS